ncbi:uncharacterized protein MKZ38_010551 [Zalerion maritima]|uniref:Mitochondrial carrier protein PET8 n=1 Tax=Zalerion maritima TaxID=339359 RepID=A0AAD5WMU1_9PEZI|nr:uncharacterized protein MKZ38_010551 [Zalerion maritima]
MTLKMAKYRLRPILQNVDPNPPRSTDIAIPRSDPPVNFDAQGFIEVEPRRHRDHNEQQHTPSADPTRRKLKPTAPSNRTALVAGAIAGTTVDLSLFPLDTLKTRLQAREGFLSSGGFRGIYRGVGSALVGSAPGAAFFFLTYESTKSLLSSPTGPLGGQLGHDLGLLKTKPAVDPTDGKVVRGQSGALAHMIAASAGEVAACAVRVPTEVVKQRAQAGQFGGSSARAFFDILAQRRAPGGLATVFRELYRGWSITILREVPFTVIQFPLWESLKRYSRTRNMGLEPSALESAVYGSAAGAAAAGLTTPLDVLKTRVMLSAEREPAWKLVKEILRENGVRPFFSGMGPRVMWISIGGFIFLGSYQAVVNNVEGRGKI